MDFQMKMQCPDKNCDHICNHKVIHEHNNICDFEKCSNCSKCLPVTEDHPITRDKSRISKISFMVIH
jgi:Fe-S-cluster-containing hydrogenase component 2